MCSVRARFACSWWRLGVLLRHVQNAVLLRSLSHLKEGHRGAGALGALTPRRDTVALTCYVASKSVAG